MDLITKFSDLIVELSDLIKVGYVVCDACCVCMRVFVCHTHTTACVCGSACAVCVCVFPGLIKHILWTAMTDWLS